MSRGKTYSENLMVKLTPLQKMFVKVYADKHGRSCAKVVRALICSLMKSNPEMTNSRIITS